MKTGNISRTVRDRVSLRALRGGGRGQGLVEFSLFLPILVMLFVGLAEIGMAARTYLSVGDACREGSRFGAAGANDADVQELVTGMLDTHQITLNPDQDDIVITRATVGPGQTASIEEVVTWSGQESPRMTEEELADRLTGDAVELDVIIVEVFYNHPQSLGVPLVSDFLPDPIDMHTYSVMWLAPSAVLS